MEKKVLNVVSVFFSVPFFFGDQLLYFNKSGYEIHIICSKSDKLKEYAKLKKFKYAEIQILRQFSVIQDLKAVFGIYKYIKKHKIEIVCGHTAKGSLVAMLAAFLARVPQRIYFRHGFYYETSKGLKKILMLNLDRLTSMLSTKVVCVSPYVVEKSLTYKLTDLQKMTLLNIGSCNGVDTENKFNKANVDKNELTILRNKYQITEENFVIGYTGRLVKDKGIVELVEAFKTIFQEHKNVILLLVGPEEERDSIPEDTIEYIRKHPQIIITGLIDEKIEYYYAMMNVLILPTHREGLGTSLLEASSMGIPTITTSHTGSRDAVVDNYTGLYIDMTSESIVEAVKKYINSPEMCRTHGENGKRYMQSNFDQKIIWQEIETKLYN